MPCRFVGDFLIDKRAKRVSGGCGNFRHNDSMTDLLTIWMSLGVVLPLLFALGELMRRYRPGRWLIGSLYLIIAVIQCGWLALLQDRQTLLPGMLFAMQPGLMLVGPLLFLFFRRLSQERLSVYQYAHLLPAVLVSGWSLYALGAWQSGAAASQPAWIVLLAGLGGAIYMALLAVSLWPLRQRPLVQAQLLLLVLMVLIGTSVGVAAVSGGLLRTEGFYQVYLSVIPGLMILNYLVHMRFPELLAVMGDQVADQQAYRRSQLGQVDVTAIIQRLDVLMEKERLFEEEGLSLASLAESLSLTSHQLSELLNDRLGMGFSRYLREIRVREAKRLLRECPQESVLTIGLRCGFNSSSAFYAAFREVAAMAPGQYRRQNARADKSGD